MLDYQTLAKNLKGKITETSFSTVDMLVEEKYTLYFRVDDRKGKLNISPSFHIKTEEQNRVYIKDYLPYSKYDENFDINVSTSKTLHKIAQDIERRLLSRFRPLYDQAKVAYEEADRKLKARQQLTRDLAAIIGTSPSWQKDKCCIYHNFKIPGRDSMHVEVYVAASKYGSNKITIDDLTTQELKELLMYIAAKREMYFSAEEMTALKLDYQDDNWQKLKKLCQKQLELEVPSLPVTLHDCLVKFQKITKDFVTQPNKLVISSNDC